GGGAAAPRRRCARVVPAEHRRARRLPEEGVVLPQAPLGPRRGGPRRDGARLDPIALAQRDHLLALEHCCYLPSWSLRSTIIETPSAIWVMRPRKRLPLARNSVRR